MTVDDTPIELANLYAEVGRELAGFDRADDLFRALTTAAVTHVPAAQYAGVTLGRKGTFETGQLELPKPRSARPALSAQDLGPDPATTG